MAWEAAIGPAGLIASTEWCAAARDGDANALQWTAVLQEVLLPHAAEGQLLFLRGKGVDVSELLLVAAPLALTVNGVLLPIASHAIPYTGVWHMV